MATDNFEQVAQVNETPAKETFSRNAMESHLDSPLTDLKNYKVVDISRMLLYLST